MADDWRSEMAGEPRPRRVITASEVGQHAYCARAWWLEHIQELESTNVREMAWGVRAHAAHGGLVGRFHLTRRLGLILLLLAALLAAAILIQMGAR